MKQGINGTSVVKTPTFINKIVQNIPINRAVVEMIIKAYQEEMSKTLCEDMKDVYIDKIGIIRIHNHPLQGRHIAGGENVCTSKYILRLHPMTKVKQLFK